MAPEPPFIPDIYNYCDHWCERCPFTARCLSYALDEQSRRAPDRRGQENQGHWERALALLEETRDVLDRMAHEAGVDMDALDMESLTAEHRERINRIRTHEIALAARLYSDMVDEWFDENAPLFAQKEEDLATLVRLEVPGVDPGGEAAAIREAVQVVRWYQNQVWLKVLRALSVEPAAEPRLPREKADGHAKVALLAVDRSIAAWGELRTRLPDEADSILTFLAHLGRLRRRTEKRFPRARAFIRPGFDTDEPR